MEEGEEVGDGGDGWHGEEELAELVVAVFVLDGEILDEVVLFWREGLGEVQGLERPGEGDGPSSSMMEGVHREVSSESESFANV